MNLFDLLNSAPFDFFYLSLDKFLDIDLPELKNFYKISPQLLGITLTEKNSGRLLSDPTVIEFIQHQTASSGRKAVIVPFKPSGKIEKICQKYGWILAANPPSLNRLFEDKIKFSEICQKNNLPVVDFVIAPYNAATFSQAQSRFGSKIVVQSHFGWAGNSTFIATDFSSNSTKLISETIVKYSPYLNGYTLLNNCCLTSRGLLQSPPALQFTGLKPLTDNPFTTVGRQWPCLAPKNIQNQVFSITDNFSKILSQYKYLGFFGLDFIVSAGKVYLLECNPRLTASFGLYTRVETGLGLNPLFLFHLAEFCHLNYSFDPAIEQRFNNSGIIGSEITLKNSSAVTISKFSDTEAFSTTLEPVNIPAGIIEKLTHETT